MAIIITIIALMLVVGTWLLVLRRKWSQKIASTDDKTTRLDIPVKGQAGSDLTLMKQASLPAEVPASDKITQGVPIPIRLELENAKQRRRYSEHLFFKERNKYRDLHTSLYTGTIRKRPIRYAHFGRIR